MAVAQELVTYLKERDLHICTAESCTGGLVAAELVDVPGASGVFEEGYITYSDRIKVKVLGVSPDTIRRFSVVSGPVAEEMAAGAADKSGVDAAVSVTGYAGPDAGPDGTPAGTVYIGLCYRGHTWSRHLELDGDRNTVRRQAAQAALSFALDKISGLQN